MPENHSRAGKRVERFSVNDDPHEFYRENDPWTGEGLEKGIPILIKTPYGNIINKEVKYFIIKCPECSVTARYSKSEEPLCPECGMVCSGQVADPRERIIRDAKASERIDGNPDEATA